MANILLGVTGSVAAVKTPELVAALRAAGHAVKVVATDSALYFFDPAALDPSRVLRNPEVVVLDEDEWPGRADGARYRRGDAVLHIELRRWADLFLVAPLDANTLAKLAAGLCDNCLTCVWRAWDPARPVVARPGDEHAHVGAPADAPAPAGPGRRRRGRARPRPPRRRGDRRADQRPVQDVPRRRPAGQGACLRGRRAPGRWPTCADLVAAVDEMLAPPGPPPSILSPRRGASPSHFTPGRAR